MKSIKSFLVIIGMMATIATATINADYETPTTGGNGGGSSSENCDPVVPDRLPIGDSADLQAMAWEQISYIGMWSWASSALNSSTNVKSSVWIECPRTDDNVVDVEEVFAIIKQQQLILSVLYPSDQVTLQVGLYGEDAYLFHSYSVAPINPSQDGVSKNVLDAVLEMSPEVSIAFRGAQWFEVIQRDEKGNPVRYYSSQEWDVQNGVVRFPAYFADKTGEIKIGLCDGTEVAYNLNGGQKITPTQVQVAVGEVSAIGMRTFREQGKIFVAVSPEESERNINPISQVLNFLPGCNGTTGFSTTTGRSCGGSEELTFAAWRMDENGRVIEFASFVSIWAQGATATTAQEWEEIPQDTHYLQKHVSAGRYWVKFWFPSGWPHGQNQFYPPYQYDGN